MNCNFNFGCCCNNCNNFVSTTSVTFVNNVLSLVIPATSLCNGKTRCIRIAQAIPTTINSNTTVVITVGAVSYSVITPCIGNFLYADQLSRCLNRIYCFKFATDTLRFIYTGGWRLCKTSHQFNCIPLPLVIDNVAEVNVGTKTVKSNIVRASE